MASVKTAIFAICLAQACPAMADPISILGLPLAGKMKAPTRVCRPSEDGVAPVKSACWISPPSVYKNTKSGSVLLPGADQLPRWAAHVTFDITVQNNGTLDEIKVRTYGANDWVSVCDSISPRFGAPTTSSQGAISRATWVRPELYAEVLCNHEGCRVKFLSRSAYDEWQQELDARKKKDAGRPGTV
jgi:hypothetical protein